jgi:beta-lactam-binding protein with PASTA domain
MGGAIALAHAGGSNDTAAHPAAGSSTMALTASMVDPGQAAPEPLVSVPDLSGASVEQATTLLASAGLRLGGVDRVLNGVPPDQVVEQNPAPGQTVARNSDVAVTLSAALPTETATAPTATSSPPRVKPANVRTGNSTKGRGTVVARVIEVGDSRATSWVQDAHPRS